ncbi:hypothetical protein NC652_028619 [Populus alba x Populus x berolinensis]|uniref:Uncharacterized protein n=1 Tax=Populus alba x Populus x berolinensis TaxID=444605 RepID=A0AAD6M480_9ROSI|nr:hypothetical protein NC651_027732 [Populus alba x Populus x berolinensis]KAJ6894936.1 hypothetical protein NC652_028619 [Populus alba x Populus x berolinensis]KAJ6978417.1 hypothetical protein NC653_026731 [Populus alba x Populus x berolinensis]
MTILYRKGIVLLCIYNWEVAFLPRQLATGVG